MATTQTTRALRGNETLLSKRSFPGNTRPTFTSNPARWSNDSATEPRVAFDVTWEGPQPPENAFHGYGVLVALNKERLDGDLVLLIRPEIEDLALATVDGDAFIDACSMEPIASGAKVLGRVVAERQFLSDRQLFDKAKAFKIAEYAHLVSVQRDRERDQAIVDRIDSGIVRAQHELAEAVEGVLARPSDQRATTVFWEFQHALKDSPAYKQLRDTFREADAQVHDDPQTDYGEGLIVHHDLDEALKELVSLVFRAGQYAGPEQYMLDPEPDDFEAVGRLITDCLARIDPEIDNGSVFRGGEPVPLTEIHISASLVDVPAYQAERDHFRQTDTEEVRWTIAKAEAEDYDYDIDFPLRSMLGRWFRARMLAARTFQKPMPVAAEEVDQQEERTSQASTNAVA